jgi:diguanylate cyclase (GGDEF)-like protein
LRENDLIARFGGDEFLVMLVGVQDLENASLIAEKLRLACLEPMQSTAGEIYASLSIGVTLARKGESSDAMISRADRAMYLAKKQGRDQVIPIPVTG